jgi:hypothetical protein
MKILIIILSIIGLLKLVSLFILCGIELYYKIKVVEINGIEKGYGIYIDDSWYIIPTIRISKTGKYFEIMIEFLCFQYYSCYNIDKDEEEK